MKEEKQSSWAVPTTRVISAVMAALVLVQAALAGGHLSGYASALGYHEMLGTEVLTGAGLVMVVVAAFAARQDWRLVVVAVVAWFGLGVQIGMGFTDQLAVHIPLGVALFGIYLAAAIAGGRRKETE